MGHECVCVCEQNMRAVKGSYITRHMQEYGVACMLSSAACHAVLTFHRSIC